MTDDSSPGSKSKGPFRCHNCDRILGWREIRAGQCQGHFVSELMSDFLPCEVRNGAIKEIKEVVQRNRMDRKYKGWGRYVEKIGLWLS